MDLIFEPLNSEHGPAVMAIFNHYVASGTAAYPEKPVPEGAFSYFQENTRGYPAYCVKDSVDGPVLGYGFIHAYHPISTFRRTAELSIFLAPGNVHRGIGSALLARLETEAKQQAIACLISSISAENSASLAFHRRNGFHECGRFHQIGFKLGRCFDIVWMEKSLA